MSPITWTPTALASEARPWHGRAWRVVEDQRVASTMKLVTTFAALDLGANDARTLALNSIEASFLPPDAKHALRDRVDAYCAAFA